MVVQRRNNRQYECRGAAVLVRRQLNAPRRSVVAVTWLVGLPAAFKTNFAFVWMFPILLAYPLSLVLVSVLESSLGWQ